MRKHVKLTAGCLTALCAAGVLIAASANAPVGSVGIKAALTASNSVPGWTRSPGGLNVRFGPGSGFPSLGTLAYNTQVSVIGYQTGEDVNGDSYWDAVNYGGNLAFLSDYWVYTAGNINQQVGQLRFTRGVGRYPNGFPIFFPNPFAGPNPADVRLPYGGLVSVICILPGPPIGGSRIWDRVQYRNITGSVADYYLYTGGAVYKQVPVCD